MNFYGGIDMLTSQSTYQEIQKAIDAGGIVEFASGIYENAHYQITKSVHLIGNGAVFIGGKRISWNRTQDGLLCCDIPNEKPLRSLVVNGELRNRCRLPESGYWQHESVFDVKFHGATAGGWERKPTEEELTTMYVPEGALDGLTLHSAETTVVHSWNNSLVGIKNLMGNRLLLRVKPFLHREDLA